MTFEPLKTILSGPFITFFSSLSLTVPSSTESTAKLLPVPNSSVPAPFLCRAAVLEVVSLSIAPCCFMAAPLGTLTLPPFADSAMAWPVVMSPLKASVPPSM